MVLENEGVYGYVTLDEYQLDFIPLDNDVLSLEFPNFFSSFFLVRTINTIYPFLGFQMER